MQCFGEHRVPELIEDVRHLQASVHAKHPHYMWGTTNMFIGVHSLKSGFIRMLRRYSHIGSQGSLIEGAEVREGAEAYAFITVLPGKERHQTSYSANFIPDASPASPHNVFH